MYGIRIAVDTGDRTVFWWWHATTQSWSRDRCCTYDNRPTGMHGYLAKMFTPCPNVLVTIDEHRSL